MLRSKAAVLILFVVVLHMCTAILLAFQTQDFCTDEIAELLGLLK